MRRLALVLIAACADDAVELAPVFEVPLDDDAIPRGLDSLVLSVARAGSDEDLASRSFAPGERVELAVVPFDDELVVHLSGQARGSQVAYGRTCVFATRPDDDPPRPHLWFARNVKFATLAIAPGPGAAAIAAGGGALMLGDDGTVEYFDPRTGTLATAGRAAPRTGSAIARLGAGGVERVAVVGGEASGFVELVELVNGTARVERIDDARLARTAMTATALTDGRVVVIGGLANGAPSGAILELANSATSTEVRSARASLATARAEHTATRLGDDVGAPVLVIGGADAAGPIAIAELWKPLSGELANPATFAPAMVIPRRGHRAELMPDGSVLVIGGVDAAGQPVRMLERFAIDAGFAPAGELPAGAGVIDITATRLFDGRILIAGGRAALGGPPVDTAFVARLDVLGGAVDVVQTDRLGAARAGHAAVTLCDGTVWITGGAPTAERYNPTPAGRR